MASLAAIRAGLAKAVTLTGLPCHPYVPDALAVGAVGAAVIDEGEPTTLTYDLDSDETVTVQLVIRVYVPKQVARSASELLDGYRDTAGAKSIKARVEADPTLDGSANSVRVTAAGPARVENRDDGIVLAACELFVEVLA